jgi:hypothetical protein
VPASERALREAPRPQKITGIIQTANLVRTNALVASSLGRNLSSCPAEGACSATVTVDDRLLKRRTSRAWKLKQGRNSQLFDLLEAAVLLMSCTDKLGVTAGHGCSEGSNRIPARTAWSAFEFCGSELGNSGAAAIRAMRIHAFQACSFNHSDISPCL